MPAGALHSPPHDGRGRHCSDGRSLVVQGRLVELAAASGVAVRRRLAAVVAGLLAVGAAPVVSAVSAQDKAQPQVQANVQYRDGAELAAQGRYVYASQGGADGGFRVLDGRSGKLLGRVSCPLTGAMKHNDIAVLRPGLVVLGVDAHKCGPNVAIFDVSRPTAPRLVGGVEATNVHTLSVHPDGRHIYVNDSGGNTQELERQVGPSEFTSTIVDARDPARPVKVGQYPKTISGCHDMSFLEQTSRVLAFCAGGPSGLLYIWDATDPAAPVELGEYRVQGSEWVHWARPSPDGKLLLISDEAVVAHTCDGTSIPGSITIADLSDPARPTAVGRISPPRGPARVGGAASDPTYFYGCTSHQFDLIPGTRTAVLSWYSGGVSVVDYTNPAAPRELGFHNPPRGQAYDAIWAHGSVWVNDLQLGLTKLRFPGL